MRLRSLLAAALLGLPVSVSASPADPAQGRAIASGEAVPRALTCARCHGLDGRGLEAEQAPRLARQSAFYLEKQLADFASGVRPSEIMAPIARALTPDQRRAVAAWFESRREVPYPPQPGGDPALLQTGGALSAVGAPARGIAACAVCHANGGRGFPPSFPYLAGQDGGYVERQMWLWKLGVRRNDPLGVMAAIARAMQPEEIRAVALYFARVRPPLDSLNRPIPTAPVPARSPGS